MVSGTVFSQGLQAGASLLLARLYTPDEFGQYASILSIATVVGAIIAFSYPTAIALAENDRESRLIAWLSMTLAASAASLVTVVLGAGVIVGVEAWGWRPDWQQVLFVPITALAIAVWGTLQFRQARLSAFHRVAMATSGGATAQVGLQIGLGWLGWGAPGLSAGYLVGRLVNLGILGRRAHLGRPPRLSALRQTAARWSEMPRWQLPTTVMNLLGTSAITPWVAKQYGLDAAGSFAFALMMLSVPAALVGQAVGTILFPRLAAADRGAGIRPDAVESYVRRLFSVAMPLFLPVLVLGPELFSLVFGSDWSGAGQVAAILSPYLAVSLASSALSSIPVVKRRLGTILVWATIDTALRFTAIAIGGLTDSDLIGFALYAAVGTVSLCGYLMWTLHMAGVSTASLLRRNWGTISLALGTVAGLLVARSQVPVMALWVITLVADACWAFVAIRKLR